MSAPTRPDEFTRTQLDELDRQLDRRTVLLTNPTLRVLVQMARQSLDLKTAIVQGVPCELYDRLQAELEAEADRG